MLPISSNHATAVGELRANASNGRIALADDSGLSVTALDGAPGIFSARWAGPGKDFAVAMRKVEERLEEAGGDDRSAWFTCALAVAWPDGPAVVVQGSFNRQEVPREHGERVEVPPLYDENPRRTSEDLDVPDFLK